MRLATDPTRRFGFWAGLATVAFALGYVVPQLVILARPVPAPWDQVAVMTASFFLAPAFVLLLAAIHQDAAPGRGAWSLSALGIGVMYAVLVDIVYFFTLTVGAPAVLAGRSADVAPFLFAPGRFLYALDVLGYTFMSVATLLAAPAVGGAEWIDRGARVALVANGLLAPVIALQMFWPALFWVAALWIVTFPASAILLAWRFHRGAGEPIASARRRPRIRGQPR